MRGDWLEHHRDPDVDGLISIIHPSESGLDDSPKYDAVFGWMSHYRPGYVWLGHRGAPPPSRPVWRSVRDPVGLDGGVELQGRLAPFPLLAWPVVGQHARHFAWSTLPADVIPGAEDGALAADETTYVGSVRGDLWSMGGELSRELRHGLIHRAAPTVVPFGSSGPSPRAACARRVDSPGVDLFECLARRNPSLIEAAATLHRAGEIPPDCYVADLDRIAANCRALSAGIADARLLTFFEAKQFGRCPPLCSTVRENGFDAALAIDMEELYALERLGVPIGHVGHLGQIPTADVEYVVTHTRPQYITVYSLDKCHQIAQVAASHGLVQPLVLRVDGPTDIVARSLAGGVRESEALGVIAEIDRTEGVRFAGFTTYPAIRFDLGQQTWVTTNNFETMTRLADRVSRELGIEVDHINAAGNICAASIGLIASVATHCEPGQAFVGGLVANAFRDQVEVPAMVYVTEVSHVVEDVPYVFASSWIANNTVGIWNRLDYDTLLGTIPGGDGAAGRAVSAKPQQFAASDPTAFMYNAIRPLDGRGAKVGETVVFGFRTQLYRSNGAVLAVVGGLADNAPRLLGLFDRNGNPVARARVQGASIRSPAAA